MKKRIISVVLMIAVIGLLLGVYYAFREEPENYNAEFSDDGNTSFDGKSVTIEVIDSNSNITKYEITTHADYLKGAMNEAEGLTYETKDGMVIVVNGERADYVLDGAYWAFYVNDDYCNYGIESQPVDDGDSFKIEYTRA